MRRIWRWLWMIGGVGLVGCAGGMAGSPTPVPTLPRETPTAAPAPTGTPIPAPTETPTPRPRAALYNFVLPG